MRIHAKLDDERHAEGDELRILLRGVPGTMMGNYHDHKQNETEQRSLAQGNDR